MNKNYLPKTTKGKIGHVIEEFGEVLQCVGKSIRFGLNDGHPNRISTNKQELLYELNDLKFAIKRLCQK